MNIFYLDKDINNCVKYHCNKHVIKMIVEYSQLLSTAHHTLGTELDKNLLYKKTHVNHPCSIWVRENKKHYQYLYKLFVALCNEYTFRYDKIHKTDKNMRHLLKTLPNNIPNKPFQNLPQAMPDNCKCEDSVLAYRNYYNMYKRHIAQWKKRYVPEWYKK